MVLLHLLQTEYQHTYNRLYVYHIHHGQRKASDDECRFIKSYCHLHDISVRVGYIGRDIDSMVNPQNSIQQVSRVLRYERFIQFANEDQVSWILTAHHLDDLVETAYFRLWTNRFSHQSLLFDSVRTANEADNRIQFAKPLIHYSKEDIYNIQKQQSIDFYEDETNKSSKYHRNYIRHEIIPKINSVENFSARNIVNLSNQLEELKVFIVKSFEQTIQGHRLKRSLISEQQQTVAKLILFEWVKFHLKSTNLDEHFEISQTEIDQLYTLTVNNKIKNYTFQRGQMTINIAYEALYVSFEDIEIDQSLHIECPGKYQFNEYEIIVTEDSHNNQYTVRTAQQHDKIKLINQSHYKKVNRVFIDHKVPLKQRQRIPVILNSNQEIIAVGHLKHSDMPGHQFIKIYYKNKENQI